MHRSFSGNSIDIAPYAAPPGLPFSTRGLSVWSFCQAYRFTPTTVEGWIRRGQLKTVVYNGVTWIADPFPAWDFLNGILPDHPLPARLCCFKAGEVARFLGMSGQMVRRYASTGFLPCVRFPGGHRRFSISDLRKFQSNQLKSQSPYRRRIERSQIRLMRHFNARLTERKYARLRHLEPQPTATQSHRIRKP